MSSGTTILFIVLAAVVAAFVRRRKRDKCLKDFTGNMVTIEKTDGKAIWGLLKVENTGMELVYPAPQKDDQGHDETTCIIYKFEYPNIQALVRFHDELSHHNKIIRAAELERTYHPTFGRKLKRQTVNVFKTVRDSVVEVVNMLISHAKKATPAGGVLTGQDKYVSQMKQELMGSVGASFEPLLEKYVGRRVVLELVKGDNILEYQEWYDSFQARPNPYLQLNIRERPIQHDGHRLL